AMQTGMGFLKAARLVLAAFLLVQASFAVGCVISANAMSHASPCHEASPSPADGSPCAAQCAAAAPVTQAAAVIGAQSHVYLAAPCGTAGPGIRIEARIAPRADTAPPPPTVPRRILHRSF